MKKIILGLSIFASTMAQANSLTCQMNEFKDGQNTIQDFVVTGDVSNPHGQMYFLKSTVFPEVSGFVSLMYRDSKNFAVFNLYSDTLQVGTSSQHQLVVQDQHLQHQMIIPSTSLQLSGIELVCKYGL